MKRAHRRGCQASCRSVPRAGNWTLRVIMAEKCHRATRAGSQIVRRIVINTRLLVIARLPREWLNERAHRLGQPRTRVRRREPHFPRTELLRRSGVGVARVEGGGADRGRRTALDRPHLLAGEKQPGGSLAGRTDRRPFLPTTSRSRFCWFWRPSSNTCTGSPSGQPSSCTPACRSGVARAWGAADPTRAPASNQEVPLSLIGRGERTFVAPLTRNPTVGKESRTEGVPRAAA